MTTHVADLADPAQVDALADELLAAHPRITLLVNNAGVSMSGSFTAAVRRGVRLGHAGQLPRAHGPDPGAAASPAGDPRAASSSTPPACGASQRPPNNAAYATSKYALRGLSESLRHDLARKGVGVTTVFPGGVATRIVQEEVPPASVSADAGGTPEARQPAAPDLPGRPRGRADPARDRAARGPRRLHRERHHRRPRDARVPDALLPGPRGGDGRAGPPERGAGAPDVLRRQVLQRPARSRPAAAHAAPDEDLEMMGQRTSA